MLLPVCWTVQILKYLGLLSRASHLWYLLPAGPHMLGCAQEVLSWGDHLHRAYTSSLGCLGSVDEVWTLSCNPERMGVSFCRHIEPLNMNVSVYSAFGKKWSSEFAQTWTILIVLGVAWEQHVARETGKHIQGALRSCSCAVVSKLQ